MPQRRLQVTRPLTREEEKKIQAALRRTGPLTCPRCGSPLDVSSIPPRQDISYVRSRVLVVCPQCRLTGVVDTRSR